ncbi:MAG: alpha/beta hydrolase [Ectothiorhodospiraceae bacterium]|nr:alpha/beta hydrolase [Ectothiorhodospiraceae bacterium]
MNTLFSRIGDYLLKKALESECKKAGLVSILTQLSFGNVEYLRSKNKSDTSSEAIVMLHGAASDKTSWVRFAKYFRSKLPLVIPDLPGHGMSVSDINLDYCINAQTVRLKELLSALGVKRAHLIGNSMGGAIALHMAASSPDLVSSLVLIDTAGVEACPSWLKQKFEHTGINPMVELSNASDYRAMMHIGMENPPYIPGIIVSALAKDFVNRKAINVKIAKDIEKDLDQIESLSKIVTPSLIIWGAADKVMHVDNAELLHQRLANSQKIVIDNVGHVPMVEAPKQVAAACSTFFAGVVQ